MPDYDQRAKLGLSAGGGASAEMPPGVQAINRLLQEQQTAQKTWDQLSPDERIERLRDCLRSKDLAIRDLRDQISRLSQHQHGPHGELLAPIYSLGMGQCIGGGHDPLA